MGRRSFPHDNLPGIGDQLFRQLKESLESVQYTFFHGLDGDDIDSGIVPIPVCLKIKCD
jgi:hypothetical protein